MKYLCIILSLTLISCINRGQNNENGLEEIIDIVQGNDDIIYENQEKNYANVYESKMTHYVTVNLRLRDGDNLYSSIVTTLSQNTALRIIETGRIDIIDGITAPWIKVLSETGYTGWCFSGYVNQLTITQQTANFPILIEHNVQANLARHFGDNMRSNVIIINKPESCAILYIEGIDWSKMEVVESILDKPILNKSIVPYRSTANIVDILSSFEIFISKEDINNINNTPRHTENRITMENLSLYFFRFEGEANWLFVIEYENNSDFYDFNIKIGTERGEIINRLGKPTYYSDDGGIFIYRSFRTLRQLHIIFDNHAVVKVQIAIFEGM